MTETNIPATAGGDRRRQWSAVASWPLTSHGKPVLENLVAATYPQLLRLARACLRAESQAHALEPSALVHETYLLLRRQRRTSWRNERHYFAIVKRLMCRVLVDHARRRGAEKRGGARPPLRLECLEELAHDRRENEVRTLFGELARAHPEAARVLTLRVDVGLSTLEISRQLGLSTRSVARRWKKAVLWLGEQLAQ